MMPGEEGDRGMLALAGNKCNRDGAGSVGWDCQIILYDAGDDTTAGQDLLYINVR